MPFLEEPGHMLHVHSPFLKGLISDSYLEKLQRAGFTTASEIILTRPESLRSKTGLSNQSINEIYDSLSQSCSPSPRSILDLLILNQSSERSSISLGSKKLDRLFSDDDLNDDQLRGIPIGSLTEITGESGCGKTCLSIQVSVNVQLPARFGGLEGGCIYLSTESSFPTSRLFQLSNSTFNRYKDLVDQDSVEFESIKVESLMRNVHLIRVNDPMTLIHTINYSLPAFLEKINNKKDGKCSLPIRLIVLDSIGAIFRSFSNSSNFEPDINQDFNHNQSNNNSNNQNFNNETFKSVSSSDKKKKLMTDRASDLNQVSDSLKILSEKFRLSTLIVNQVSDVIQQSPSFSLKRNDQNYENVQSSSSSSSLIGLSNSDSFNRSISSSSSPLSSLVQPQRDFNRKSHSLNPLKYLEQSSFFNGQVVTRNKKEASLGFAWSNCINLRIMLTKLDQELIVNDQNDKDCYCGDGRGKDYDKNFKHDNVCYGKTFRVREARVVFSPFGRTKVDDQGFGVRYFIGCCGIIGL